MISSGSKSKLQSTLTLKVWCTLTKCSDTADNFYVLKNHCDEQQWEVNSFFLIKKKTKIPEFEDFLSGVR